MSRLNSGYFVSHPVNLIHKPRKTHDDVVKILLAAEFNIHKSTL